MTGRVAIYVRISDDKTGEGLGIDRQEEDCRKLAERLGFEDATVFKDNDVSAYSGRKRPRYVELLDALSSGKFAVVIAWHADRLHRSPTELEAYILLVEKNAVETHFATDGLLDLKTSTGRLAARMVGNIARYESEHKADRIKRAHKQSAERGKWRGGTRPFGYKSDAIAVDVEEASLIQAAYRSVIAGISLIQICREWNASGVKTATGRQWCIQSLKQLLLRERNRGMSLYRGEVVGNGQWEALIDEETYRRAKAILSDPTRRRSFDTRGRWLLSGLGLCGVCAATGQNATVRSAVSGGPREKRSSIYRCASGLHFARNATKCDALITEVLLTYLSSDDARGKIGRQRADPTGRAAPLDLQAQKLRDRIDDAKSLWRDSIISADELRSETKGLRAKLSALETQMMADSHQVPAMGDLLSSSDIRAAWAGLTWAQKRSVIDLLMVVTIKPVPSSRKRAFHSDLMQIDWK